MFSTTEESDSETMYFSIFSVFSTKKDVITEEITLLNFSGDAVAIPTTGRFDEKETLSETAVAVWGSTIHS